MVVTGQDAATEPLMTPPGHPVVAVAASVGGLTAVTELLSDLPEGFGATVVVLIHQDPDRAADQLVPILAKSSSLPIAAAVDGTALQPGTVIVVPAGQHLVVFREEEKLTAALIPSGASPPSRPSADLLFTSLAVAARERTIAVVLSGYGHDGATGATAVSRFRGTVIASDEATSQVFSMPAATIQRDDAIDYVAPTDQIASILLQLTGR